MRESRGLGLRSSQAEICSSVMTPAQTQTKQHGYYRVTMEGTLSPCVEYLLSHVAISLGTVEICVRKENVSREHSVENMVNLLRKMQK